MTKPVLVPVKMPWFIVIDSDFDLGLGGYATNIVKISFLVHSHAHNKSATSLSNHLVEVKLFYISACIKMGIDDDLPIDPDIYDWSEVAYNPYLSYEEWKKLSPEPYDWQQEYEQTGLYGVSGVYVVREPDEAFEIDHSKVNKYLFVGRYGSVEVVGYNYTWEYTKMYLSGRTNEDE